MSYFKEQLEKARAAGFAELLARFIETDGDGHHSFNYPMAYGHAQSVIDHLDDLLQAAVGAQSQRQQSYLKDAAAYVAKTRQEFKEIDLLWDRHIASRRSGVDDTEALIEATLRKTVEKVG